MKKVARTIVATIAISSMILAGCENPDGSCDIVWTLGWMASCVIFSLIFKRLDDGRAKS